MELYVDYRFKKIGEKELKIIDDAVNNIMKKFTIVYANSQAVVYKIMNYLIDKHKLDDKNIKTLDGAALECYFDIDANPKYNHMQLNRLLENGILSDVAGKLLMIPKMDNRWNKELVFYFYNEVRYAGCLGIVFYSERKKGGYNGKKGGDHFGKILLEETTLDVIQFPNKIYGSRFEIEDDEW